MTRIYHVSDLHFGAEDREALAWFARRVREDPPDAVVVTGDITQRAKKREFAAAADYLAALPAPVTVEPGNHDLPYFNLIERFTRPYKRLARVQDMVNAELQLQGCTIVPLKTTARFQLRFNWALGHIDRKSVRTALRQTRAAPAGQQLLVASHHPLVDVEIPLGGDREAFTKVRGRTRGGGDALHRLAASGADAVLTGHVHTPFHVRHQASGRTVHLIGAGTLSERLREHEPSFNEVTVRQDDIMVAHHTFGEDSRA